MPSRRLDKPLVGYMYFYLKSRTDGKSAGVRALRSRTESLCDAQRKAGLSLMRWAKTLGTVNKIKINMMCVQHRLLSGQYNCTNMARTQPIKAF